MVESIMTREDAISDPEHTEGGISASCRRAIAAGFGRLSNRSFNQALRNECVPATSADERSSLPEEAAMGPIRLVDPDTGEMSHATIEDVPEMYIFSSGFTLS